MPSWRGKSSGNRLGYSIFIAVLKTFGVQPAYVLLRVVSLYYFLFAWKSSRHILYYFQKRLGYSFGRSITALYKNYYCFGQSLIDKIAIMSGMAKRFSFDFDGEAHLHQLVSLQKGGLLLSSHIGNWEAAGHLLERLNTRINVVMFDGEHQKIKDYLTSVTGERNARIIVIKNDLSHIYAINEALKNKELVCIHADRFVEGNRTLIADFLGKAARFPAGPFVLAAQFKVPVCYVFAMKEGNTHYHFYSTAIKMYDYGDKTTAMQQMLSDFTAEMEKKVKQYPAQWYNYYDFWANA
ncbi:LpxL/LpxP family acyltransferase [Agriterribacter humi]|uniref:LpxL/LpxP family acyltransferase n=1 Tax=Agriterribacter humi TaxID=1104781 RepID=UPI00126463FF|nr:lipid A biosynthesis acyltransferase [Agriterribacter humi]